MTRHHFVLALAVVSVSFAAIFIRLAQAPPLVIATYRLCIASLLIDPVTCIRSRQELRRLTTGNLALALLSGAFLAVHFVLWISSLSYTTVASSVVLVTANPIFVGIASYFLFHEKLSRQTILGIGISFTGAVLIGYGGWNLGSRLLLGDLLALLGALAIAGYFLIGRRLRPCTSLLTYASLVYTSAALILLVSAIVFRCPFFGYSPTTYAMFLLLALVPQLLGHLSLNWALRFVPATLVTVAVLGEPVGATMLAFAVLGEVPTVCELGGGTLVLAGIFIAFQKSREQMRQR